MVDRSLEIFLSTLKTESTKKNYLYWLNQYLKHCKKYSYDELLLGNPEQIQTDLENYILELRRIRTTRSALKANIYALLHFFGMNRVILNEKIIKKLLPEQEGKIGGNAYSTEDIRKIISAVDQYKIKKHKRWNYLKPRAKALVHFIASSGVRLGAIPDLKVKDVNSQDDCHAVTIYRGTKDEYLTFITPEAKKALDEFLSTRQNLTPESSLFDMEYDGLRLCLYRLVKKAKVSKITVHTQPEYDKIISGEKSPRHRLDIPTVHGMRKRWNTIFKSNNTVNANLIELMMGHSTQIKLDEHYLKPTKEILFVEYQKGVKDLTLFN